MTSAAGRGAGTSSPGRARPSGLPPGPGVPDHEPGEASDGAAEERIAAGPACGEQEPGGGEEPIDQAELDRICLHNLLSACADMIYFKDRESRFLRVSDSAAAFTGTVPSEMIGKTVRDYFTPEHAAAAFATEKTIMATGWAVNDFEEPHLRPGTPEEETLSASKQPLRDFDGRIIGTFGISRDITARKISERQLRERTAELDRVGHELRTLLDTSPDLMARYDRELRCTYANPAATELTGVEMLGRTSRERGYAEEFLTAWEESLRHVLATGQDTEREFGVIVRGEHRYLHTRFVPELGADGEVSSVLSVSRDLTDRRRIENALAEQAVRDPLTGLANRTLLVSRVREAIGLGAADHADADHADSDSDAHGADGGRLAVLFLDLDRFKLVNDSLGHAAGDELLVAVADRLRRAVRRGDLVARFGGDEFVVLCENVDGRTEAAAIAERVIDCLVRPFECAGKPIHVRTSIGIALARGPEATVDELLRDADAAMYQAKSDGAVGGGYRFFEPATHARAMHRMTVEQDLRQAVERGEFTLLYQPIVALSDGRLTGAEALIRWRHPERGLLAPADFLDVAEETQLIVPIGRWVLDEACRQLAEWDAALPRDDDADAGAGAGARAAGAAGGVRAREEAEARLPQLAVNLSSRQLSHDTELVRQVAKAIARHGVPSGRICLEVTETAVHEAWLTAHTALTAFSTAGIKIALDDYGTGYSSLGHLRDNPVDTLKIDRVFISGLTRNPGDDAIVVAVITLAHALGMRVVAEGVETTEQRDRLRELGCDFAQGYLFAMPLAPEEFGKLLHSGAAMVGAVSCG